MAGDFGRPWTEIEKQIVRERYAADGRHALGLFLNRTHRSVEAMAVRLKATALPGMRWIQAEDDFLLANAEAKPAWLAEKLKRRWSSIRARMTKLGIVYVSPKAPPKPRKSRPTRYASRYNDRFSLKRLVRLVVETTLTYEDIAKLLKVTRGTVRYCAQRNGAGRYRETKLWNTQEDDFLREHYGRARMPWIEGRLGRNKSQILGRAHRLGLGDSRRSRRVTKMQIERGSHVDAA